MSVTWPFWLDCFPGLLCTDALAFPYPATALLSLTDPTEHAGRGDSPAPIPVRADATSSRDGLPFSLGSGFSPVKVTLSTEDAAMHAGLAAIQLWFHSAQHPCTACSSLRTS